MSLEDLVAAAGLGGVILYGVLGGADFGGGIWDLCAGGVSLLTARPLPWSRLVLLDVPGAEVVGARVQHAAEQPDGTWLAGCALLGRFNPDDLQRLTSEGGGPAEDGTREEEV